jgi:hypothetical protein
MKRVLILPSFEHSIKKLAIAKKKVNLTSFLQKL